MGTGGLRVMVCFRVKESGLVAPGSIVECCEKCGQDVWIAPTGQDRLRAEPMRILCLPCAAPELQGPEDIEEIPPEIRAEVEKTTGRPFSMTREDIWRVVKRRYRTFLGG